MLRPSIWNLNLVSHQSEDNGHWHIVICNTYLEKIQIRNTILLVHCKITTEILIKLVPSYSGK